VTGGNKTRAVALAIQRLLDQEGRGGSLFGAHRGSVKFADDVDLTAPVFADALDAQTGAELDHGG
jgi:hypothetical protein